MIAIAMPGMNRVAGQSGGNLWMDMVQKLVAVGLVSIVRALAARRGKREVGIGLGLQFGIAKLVTPKWGI